MTPHDAAVLSRVGGRHKRLADAVVRHLLHRPLDDERQLPARGAHESMAEWICRLLEQTTTSRPSATPFTPAFLDDTAAAALSRAQSLGISALMVGATSYPRLLAQIADPPPLLWVRGDVDDLHRTGVAVVGSRAASPHGRAMARTIARDLAAAHIVVTSGLARGIDSVAHEAALAAGGRTVAVLGSAHDRVYPPEHAELASCIERAGAVLSEYPPGTGARAHHFPMRNRIISGLARAVLVVEAPERSGALITATSALDQNRDVFVVPGPVPGDRNRGGHALIRDGAKMAESARDILCDLGWPLGDPAATPRERHPWLCRMSEGADFTVDQVADLLTLPAAEVLAGLLELELAGRIQRIGGGRFVRCRAAC
ncbi:MAG: DNA-processing protein DprA [Vicinamibacterales bacterium]